MKKSVIIIFFFVIMPFLCFGQRHNYLTFSGNISSNTTWNAYDTIYIIGNVTVNSGITLNISPNTTGSNAGNDNAVYVIFTGSYLFTVSSTAVLNVNGTSSKNIYFTADYASSGTPTNGNKIFGETGERWKDLYFNSAATSTVDYAIIEWGTGNSNQGGGIWINGAGNNTTIKNTTVRYCTTTGVGGGISLRNSSGTNVNLDNVKLYNNSSTSSNGGALAINTGGSTINNCEFHDNSGGNGDGIFIGTPGAASTTIKNSIIYSHSGEGIYITVANGATISNCIIYGNTTGVSFINNSGNVINCTIVNNTTGVISGSGNSTHPVLANNVLWGNSSQQYNINTNCYLNIANCGIQGGLRGQTGETDGGNNINLNSSNTAADGPNFVNTSSNFHLNAYKSPLVNAGTTSYSGLTYPSSDKDGQARIGTIDIGAYEFVYYVWAGTTSTSWTTASNWQGPPLSSVPTTLTGNYVYIPKVAGFYPTASSLSLSSGTELTIDPEAGLTVTGTTTVNSGCTFLLKSDASGSANFITGSSVSGNFDVELFLDGGGAPNYNWHYVMTPVNGVSTDILTTDIGNIYNLLNYLEYNVTTDKNEGWNWFDQYNGSSGFATLTNDMGNLVYVSTDQTAHFTGSILESTEFYFYPFCGEVETSLSGWNLIGNPFTTSLDLESLSFGADVNKVVYFTTGNNYCSYNIILHNGVNGATRYVSSMQGFFVHAIMGGTYDYSFSIPASARIYNGKELYKGSEQTFDYPFIKFNVSNSTGDKDESLICFLKDATPAFDVNYDATKMLCENPAIPQVYSLVNNKGLSMNSLPYPVTSTVVPLKVRIGLAGDYTINVQDLQNLSDYKVKLLHGNQEIDLKTNPVYSFSAVPGTISDMSIIFENATVGIRDVATSTAGKIQSWYENGIIYLKTGSDLFENNSKITVFDINGKQIFTKDGAAIYKDVAFELPVNLVNGIYITTINNSNNKLSGKIIVTK